MTGPYPPIVNRGAEALAALLTDSADHAAEQVRLLTRTELLRLADTAETLAAYARRTVAETWPAHTTTKSHPE